MEAKDLRTESTLSERSIDGKYGPSGASLQCTKSKTYQDMGSSPSTKVDSPVVRPCAVIGPDRVIPPSAPEAYLKKASVEPWLFPNNSYRRPPEYPSKIAEYQNHARNISPRQTYQENMQRIMVPPSYSSIKVNEDFHQTNDRNGALPPNNSIKLNVTPDNKYCEVPYTISNTVNDQKTVRNPEICVNSVNQQHPLVAPQGWTPGCASVRPRGFGASDLYQYPEYSSCAGPRVMPITRPHRTLQESAGYVYPESYYQDANIRFKPYPNLKDRYVQPRYEYISNYRSPFYPPSVPPHKYEMHKSLSTHPYPTYTPLKGLESRMSEPIMEGYHRTVPQGSYNMHYRNAVIHPPYGSVIANGPQDKLPPYISDSTTKIPASSKPPYDAHNNVYVDYENSRLKAYSTSENLYSNEMKMHSVNNPIMMPNYPPLNMHTIPPHPYYKKDSLPLKSYDCVNNLKNMDPLLNAMNPISNHLPHFSPGGIPISPTNSNASNETTPTQNMLLEDCGYVSQSSGASVRSIDSATYRSNEYYKRYYDPRYRPIIRTSPVTPKQEHKSHSLDSKDKKQINVRQFLQMWNEGEDEIADNDSNKEAMVHPTSDTHSLSNSHDSGHNNEQLYVLGLVNVPSEEISKYEHLQTVSKLPENIKGYNSIELLDQFEEVIESTSLNYYKSNSLQDNKMTKSTLTRQTPVMISRPLSPLDVEAKISQSVIHKEVGCNFEIKPCSPKMLNAELATPVQNIFSERAIEKVTNPLSTMVTTKSSLIELDNCMDTCNIPKNQNHTLLDEHMKTQSCKMANGKYSDIDSSLKTNYSLQDLESNSGVCLASLPRLDNDIELNFPEVNQQFINANKTESNHMQSIESEKPELTITNRNQISESKSTESIVQSVTGDIEKHVSKLSKFRKNKKTGLDVTDEGPQPKIIRTDSVIIKNPDNIKNLDENIDYYPAKSLNRHQLSPINLVRSPYDILDSGNGDSVKSDTETTKIEKDQHSGHHSVEEIAIDFSFNKNKDSNCLEISKELEIDISPESIINSSEVNSKDVLINSSSQDASSSATCGKEKLDSTIEKSYSEVNNIIDNAKRIEVNEINSKDEDTKKEKNDIEKYDSTENKEQYPISDNIIIVKKKIDQSPLIESPDNLNSKHEVFYKTQHNDDDIVKEKDNNINNLNNIDNNEFNKGSDTSNSELKNSQIVLISNLVDLNTVDGANVCNKSEDISQRINSDSLDTKLFEKGLISEQKDINIRVEDRDEHVDGMNNSSNQDSVSVCSEKKTFTELIRTNIEDMCDKKRESSCSTLTRDSDKLNTDHTHTFVPDIGNEYKLCNNNKTTDVCCTNPIIYNKEENQKKILKIEQDQTEYCSDKSMDVLSSELEVPLHSVPYNLDQNPKSKASTFSKGDLENHLNKSEIAEVVNITKLDKETYEENRIGTQSPLNRKDYSEYLTDNADCFVPTRILFEEIQIKSMDINEDNRNGRDACEDKSEITDSKTCFVEKNTHVSTLLSPDIISNDKKEHISNSENAKSDLKKSVSKDPDVLSHEPEISMDKVSQTKGIINEKISIPGKTNQLDLQGLGNLAEINNMFKYFPNDNTNYASPQECISQTVINQSGRVHNEKSTKQIEGKCNSAMLLKYTSKGNILFRKRVYSPLIQKLIIYSEGKCNDNKDLEFTDIGFTKEGYFSEFQTKNAVENRECNNYKREIFEDSELTENSRLVDYDSSDYSLSPVAPKYIQEISSVESIEVNKNKHIYTEREYEECHEHDNIHDINTDNNVPVGVSFNYQENPETKDDDYKMNANTSSMTLEYLDDNDTKKIDETVTAASTFCQVAELPQHSLKRSLSDSALFNISDNLKYKSADNIPYTRSFKRNKLNNDISDSPVVTANLCNVMNSNRRNSISAIYTEDNISFCIVFDNDCIITEEDNDRLCYTEIPENLFQDISNNSVIESDLILENTLSTDQEDGPECTKSFIIECDQNTSPEESCVDDVACVETVVSDDIAEDITISATSPGYISDYEEAEVFCFNTNEHTDKVKHIYGDKLCQNDAELVETLYNTPQKDVNKTLIHRESQGSEDCDRHYDQESLERMLSDSHCQEKSPYLINYNDSLSRLVSPLNKDNLFSPQSFHGYESPISKHEKDQTEETGAKILKTQDDTVHSCESSVDNVFSYSQPNETIDGLTFSSPEVSSTTSEEKGSSILLKITNFKGSIVSQISEYSSEISNKNSFRTNNDNFDSSDNKLHSKKPLVTKAAQKYIPPLKETIRDLKVQISLPQDSLKKLRQMKLSREELKHTCHKPSTLKIAKKPKPKFEDVLKSIDEIQFKMHKEKSKKNKKSIPKVVIKKSLNGSHYTSTKNKDTFNPDLTGRKWQPWVFLEKDSFIDKMALKKKTKAIFNHRKKTFVLAEKFYKYKSVNSSTTYNSTFVITQPTYSKPSSGQLKYTIRLKHSY